MLFILSRRHQPLTGVLSISFTSPPFPSTLQRPLTNRINNNNNLTRLFALFSTSARTSASKFIFVKKSSRNSLRDNTPFLPGATTNNIKALATQDFMGASNKVKDSLTRAERAIQRANAETGNSTPAAAVDKYSAWSREALLARIQELEASHGVPATSRPAAAAVVGPTLTKADIQQGKDSNTAASTPQSNQENVEESGRKRKLKDRRPFDFSKYAKRHIALRIAYFGWPYGGFASQGINEIKTVESELFNALLAGRLIDDPQNCDYSRCGRTDRGVSGLGQVVALTVRSSLPKDSPFVIQPKPEGEEGGATETDKNNVEQKTEEEQEREWAVLEAEESTKGELAYISMINRLLPPDIRVLAWTPVPEDFNARFNCDWREYKYFFPRGTIDIDRMRLGAKKYLGAHDFRNFCKFDNTKEITNYERVVLDIRIDPVPGYEFPEHSGRQFYELTLRGTAFLWHQVRCMMSVLFTIGHGLEEPEVIDALMDVENCPAKPTYDMASDLPLVLYDCHFKRVKWLYQTEVGVSSQNDMMAMRLYRSMEDAWSSHMIKSLMYSRLLSRMDQATLLNINEAGEKVKLGEHAEQNAHKETSISLGADLRMFMGKGYNKLMGRQKCLPIAEKSKRQQEKKRQKLALLDSEVNSSAENTDVDSSPAVVEKQTDATA